MWRWGDDSSEWKTFGFTRIHFGDMPAACALENGKRMVIDAGYEIDLVVAEQMKTSYVDDGLGRGTDELMNWMVGGQTEIDGELFTNGTVSQILAKGSLRTKAMVR